MNLYGAVVFCTLLFTFFVKLVSELLNLKAAIKLFMPVFR